MHTVFCFHDKKYIKIAHDKLIKKNAKKLQRGSFDKGGGYKIHINLVIAIF